MEGVAAGLWLIQPGFVTDGAGLCPAAPVGLTQMMVRERAASNGEDWARGRAFQTHGVAQA